MYIRISASHTVTLEESDNFREFSIIDESDGSASEALGGMSSPAGDDHFWLSADAVIQLSGRSDDQSWVEAFWAMLAAVEAYGYSDMKARQVKAHRVRR